MPVDNETFCTVVDAFVPPFCVPLPGGGEICLITGPGQLPISADVCKDLLGQLNVALAGLAPIMCIIDCVLSVIEVGKAVPDSIGPPPDPSALIKAIANMVEKCACLLPLIPQLSICPLIKQLLALIIACLEDIIAQIENLITLSAGVADAREICEILDATNSVGLDLSQAKEYLDCEEQNLDLLAAALGGSTESIQRLLDVTVNPLMSIAGLDPIVFEDINFGDLETVQDALIPLRAAIDALTVVRDALPC
jgi:hypothetical protein